MDHKKVLAFSLIITIVLLFAINYLNTIKFELHNNSVYITFIVSHLVLFLTLEHMQEKKGGYAGDDGSRLLDGKINLEEMHTGLEVAGNILGPIGSFLWDMGSGIASIISNDK